MSHTYIHVENGSYSLKYKLKGFGEIIQKEEGVSYMTIEKDKRILVYELVKCEKKKSV